MYVWYGCTFIKSKMTSRKQRIRKVEEKALLLEFLLPQIVLCMHVCMFVRMHVRMYLKYVTVVRLLKAK